MTKPNQFILSDFLTTFLHLIYPNICFHCEKKISPDQHFLCHACWSKIKIYQKENDPDNQLESRLKGKIQIESIHTLFWFHKNSPLQTLLHALKYQYKPMIGDYLGELLGQKIKKELNTQSLTGVLPIPIHSLKKIERGYNQTEKIMTGLRKAIPHLTFDLNGIEKAHQSESQTKKNRLERWINLTESFNINFQSDWLKNQSHILIIDDVITTGATIEALGKLINGYNPNIKISVATLAITG